MGYVIFLFILLIFAPFPAQGKTGSDKPDLVVGIVVEKMRYDYLTRMWDMFGDNGFKKLVSEGSFFDNAGYQHLTGQTSPGFATIYTGSTPSEHGIVADKWYDRLSGNIIRSVEDNNVSAVGGSFLNGHRSPKRLYSTTIGDELRMYTNFRSRVYSVALNDVAAVLSGGFSANGSWWFDVVNGVWMSSNFYTDYLPEWVGEFNETGLQDIYLERKWEPLMNMSSYFRIDGKIQSTPFSYDLRQLQRNRSGYGLLKATPYGNTITREFAVNLMVNEELGKRGETDMVLISFSATSEIGSKYGDFSPELQDAYLRLDMDIAYLINFLERHAGESNVLVFLTSDRSVSYPSSHFNEAGVESGTFSPVMAVSLLRSYLNIYYGPGDWVVSYNSGMIYLNHLLIEERGIAHGEIQERSSRFLNQFSGVAGSITESVLINNSFSHGIPARIEAGFNPGRSGDITIYLHQGWYERVNQDDRPELISYDRHVPLLFWGWGIKPQRVGRQVSTADIAPTVSRLLNIPVPPFSTGVAIPEIFD